jgi:hypothetical protein
MKFIIIACLTAIASATSAAYTLVAAKATGTTVIGT